MTRVISGSARGRRLVTPAGLTTRPTSDRAREGLFNTLGNLHGLTFLDLYAGTGAIGLEALSRGAEQVTLVESDKAALAAIRTNIATVDLPGVAVIAQPVEKFLTGRVGGFDVVFLDPPHAHDVTPTMVAALPAVADRLIVERATRDREPIWPVGIELVKSRKYGEATLWYGARS